MLWAGTVLGMGGRRRGAIKMNKTQPLASKIFQARAGRWSGGIDTSTGKSAGQVLNQQMLHNLIKVSVSLPRDLLHVAFVRSPAVLLNFSTATFYFKALLVECSVICDILTDFRGSLCLGGRMSK